MRSWGKPLVLGLVLLVLIPGLAEGQLTGNPHDRVHVGLAVYGPQRWLPGRDTSSGQAQGRLTTGPGVWVDAVFPRARPGVRGYVQGVLAFTDVQWHEGGGQGVAGLAGLGSAGVDWSVQVRDWLTPYLRTGVGANVYLLGSDGACIPEDPTCGLHNLYKENHLDPAVQIVLGAEFFLLGRGVVVEASDSWSRFTAGDSSSTQRFLSFGIGMGF